MKHSIGLFIATTACGGIGLLDKPSSVGPVFEQDAVINPSFVEMGTVVECVAEATDPNGERSVLSFYWQINGSEVSGGPTWTVDSILANVGDSLTCSAVAEDVEGNATTSISPEISISNSAPVINGVLINLLNPYTNDMLMVSASHSDFNGDPVTFTYEWHVIDASNGGQDTVMLLGSGEEYSTFDGSQTQGFDRDDEVYVTVTPNDGFDDGMTVESGHVMVLNSAPNSPLVVVSSISSPPLEGVDDLTCTVTSASVDDDGDAVDYTYNWFDPTGATVQSLSNTSTLFNTFSGSSTSIGLWECEVVASDGLQTNSTFSDIEVEANWGGAVTFTNCGQTGSNGPSQLKCDTVYSGTSLDGLVSINSGFQTWTVPINGPYLIEVAGAEGGYSNAGLGAVMIGEFVLISGDVLTIAIGQSGITGATGGGGGGGSFVVNVSTPLVVAGGGGGSHYYLASQPIGGQSTETDKSNATTGSSYGGASGGGWFGDGANGTHNSTGGKGWANGLIGGTKAHWDTGDGGFGGGGGSAWSPGGGGGYNGGTTPSSYGNAVPGGSGGGSYNAGTNQSNSSDSNIGQGYVVIEKL
jgi:hypothetical protein